MSTLMKPERACHSELFRAGLQGHHGPELFPEDQGGSQTHLCVVACRCSAGSRRSNVSSSQPDMTAAGTAVHILSSPVWMATIVHTHTTMMLYLYTRTTLLEIQMPHHPCMHHHAECPDTLLRTCTQELPDALNSKKLPGCWGG